MAGSSSRLERLSTHPIGAALCLALGYMLLSSAYIVFWNQFAARSTGSADQLRHIEWLKCGAFVLITGTAFFGFAAFLLKRIAIQQRHLALIFEGVSDCLFLVQIEANANYRFLCVNAAFLKVTGLTREQVVGKRIEEVLPEASHVRVRSKFQEAIRERKMVSWQGSAVAVRFATQRSRRRSMVTLLLTTIIGRESFAVCSVIGATLDLDSSRIIRIG